MSRPVYCHAVAHCGGGRVRRDEWGRYYTDLQPIAHAQTPQCVDPHEVPPSGNTPSMTAVETLDPREAVAS